MDQGVPRSLGLFVYVGNKVGGVVFYHSGRTQTITVIRHWVSEVFWSEVVAFIGLGMCGSLGGMCIL